ncbi:hypothetical protein AKJ08_0039 [Vulgatibacter incomptus]|uniref:Uncharacterized protein n=1 Tax=Vulgatibacter incomptus TaxID=1391653 RepID=A0A0K1P814_9BACT|nr:hypothetical protein AKJ08_0039 [Vulgatibacter incomptus]
MPADRKEPSIDPLDAAAHRGPIGNANKVKKLGLGLAVVFPRESTSEP